jgi:type I restriction enzyme M protein
VNPQNWAVSKSDFFTKDPHGRNADNIAFGSTLLYDVQFQFVGFRSGL